MAFTRKIKNRAEYPQVMRAAVQREAKVALRKGEVGASARLAEEFNIHKSTVCDWRRQAGVAEKQPWQLAKHQATMAADKAFNTPTVVWKDKAKSVVSHITFRGNNYR